MYLVGHTKPSFNHQHIPNDVTPEMWKSVMTYMRSLHGSKLANCNGFRYEHTSV